MSEKIGIIYNEPVPGKYHHLGEGGAIDNVLDSVAAVSQALSVLGYDCVAVPLKLPLSLAESEINKLDAAAVFNLFEGFDGVSQSEAAVASFLEKKGVCFTGSPSYALRICEDKARAKQLLREQGIATPDWQVLTPDSPGSFNLAFPCIVKPLGENASHGISEESVVTSIASLQRRVSFIAEAYERPSLVEEFISGREFCALVIGSSTPAVLPIEEIIYSLPPDKPKLLTYAAKWVPGGEYFSGTRAQCPADIDAALKRDIEKLALAAYGTLGCSGYARVDIRQDGRGRAMVLEVNSNPDISSEGGVRLHLEAAGIAYPAFIRQVLDMARERCRQPVRQ